MLEEVRTKSGAGTGECSQSGTGTAECSQSGAGTAEGSQSGNEKITSWYGLTNQIAGSL